MIIVFGDYCLVQVTGWLWRSSYFFGVNMENKRIFEDEEIILNTFKKVFAIFNINTELKKQNLIKLEQDKFKEKDKVKLSKAPGQVSNFEISFSVRNLNNIFSYSFKHEFTDEKVVCNLKDIIFIFKNCLKALKTLLSAYFAENISVIEINGCIEETIELSIIAIAMGNRKPTYNIDSSVIAISSMLHALDKWSNRTYEGRKIPYSFLLDLGKLDTTSIYKLCEFLKDDASALLTDGITSYIGISDSISYGVATYFDAEQTNSILPLVPYRFSSFGNMCSGRNLGIILTVQGDILFIKGKKLIFAKRNNDWHSYDYDAFNEALFKDMPEMHIDASQKNNRIKLIYLACLDVAFARTGGCLAICQKDNVVKVKSCINPNDIHSKFNKSSRTDYHYKRYILEDVVIGNKNFNSITRKARQELLGIDGATVISTDGSFVTTGAIMDNKFKNDTNDMHGGARTKIAMKLSEYGVAIKISADGYIECYINHKNIY